MPEGRRGPQVGPPLFFNTVTLSNFALVGQTVLLVARYGVRAQVTAQVLDELLEGVAAGYGALSSVVEALAEGDLSSAGGLSADERRLQGELLRTLGPGEASAVACAKLRAGTVVTDDRAARNVCRDHGVPCTGTIGILLASVRDGNLDSVEADALLEAMVERGYFSPVRRISDLL